ncbi:histo-blood group ABO system transferase-like [Pelodytes ibericus]
MAGPTSASSGGPTSVSNSYPPLCWWLQLGSLKPGLPVWCPAFGLSVFMPCLWASSLVPCLWAFSLHALPVGFQSGALPLGFQSSCLACGLPVWCPAFGLSVFMPCLWASSLVPCLWAFSLHALPVGFQSCAQPKSGLHPPDKHFLVVPVLSAPVASARVKLCEGAEKERSAPLVKQKVSSPSRETMDCRMNRRDGKACNQPPLRVGISVREGIARRPVTGTLASYSPVNGRSKWLRCESVGAHLYQLKEIKIERILYEKPDTLKPPRTDVLTVTPWLAPIIWNGTFNIDILKAQFHQKGVRIGLTVFAIKKYIVFLKNFIATAEKFFMVGHRVNYYVFTDLPKDVPNVTLSENRSLIVLEVPAYKRWQDVTMRRMEMIRDQVRERFIHEVDYLVSVDVDMKFFDDVGVEILSDVFGTLHPGFFGTNRKQFTYERRPQSEAYIPFDEGDFYYAGGYFGGKVEEVYKLTNHCHNAMLSDKEKGIEALWHDESYLNKYFLYHKPTKVLSPEYVWNNYYGSPAVVQKKRFVGIDKNYKDIRFK